jgi:hypothetical protein
MQQVDAAPAAFAVREFCAWANISRSSFYKEVQLGRIKPVKAGCKTLILRTEAERWLSSLPALK